MIARSIDLNPEDWLCATWRQRLPQLRPQPSPFNQQEALARLAKVSVRDYSWRWNWAEAEIAVSLTQEEAHFWFAAMTEAKLDTQPKKLANRMAERIFTGEVSFEQMIAGLEEATHLTPEIVLPLWHLLPVKTPFNLLQLGDRILTRPDAEVPWYTLSYDTNRYQGRAIENLTFGFQKYVLPYMTQAEVEELQQLLRPALSQTQWSTSYYEVPPAVFHLAAALGMSAELLAVVESWPDNYYGSQYWYDHNHQPQKILFGLGDPGLVETHMRRLKLRLKSPTHIRAWLACTEYTALDWVRDSILSATSKEDAVALAEVFVLVKAPEAAPYMLELMLTSKASKPARQWLETERTHAIAGLIPVATGRGTLAEAAIKFLRGMKRKGQEAFIRERIEQESVGIADKVRAAVLEFAEKDYVAFDSNTTPEWLQTAVASILGQKGKLPAWIDITDLPAVVVGCRLNDEQVAALLYALQQSQLQSPHPLVSELRVRGDRSSLDAFAWELFEQWLLEGASSKEKWAMIAVGLLGTDTSALKLAPLIRVWPGENQHPRAVLGLQCLRTIGTDTAIMQINGIAQKLKFKGLKEQAKQCMEDIAKDRGLTSSQLEDRIVPDCDLDERGSRVFDFGSRQFRFVLSGEMKPMLRDQKGKLITNLPKPGAKDDADLAAEAIADWKLLKKQVSEIAKIQAVRLEQAMVTGRRWSRDEFETLLVHHPLMTNLVRLLVWGGYNASESTTFRVTEDQTYADAEDEICQLEDITAVGIVHPLNLSETLKSAWGELFSDYEIVPPFPQLSRTIYTLEPGEAESIDITRFQDISIPAVSLVGTLEKLGWLRGTPQDAGVFNLHYKPFASANAIAVIGYDGVPVGSSLVDWEDQRIESCFFVPGIEQPRSYWDWEHKRALKLGEIDPVAISEVLGDLSVVAAKAK